MFGVYLRWWEAQVLRGVVVLLLDDVQGVVVDAGLELLTSQRLGLVSLLEWLLMVILHPMLIKN